MRIEVRGRQQASSNDPVMADHAPSASVD